MTKEILRIMLPIGAVVLFVAAILTVLWAFSALRARRRTKAIELRASSDEVTAATIFWYNALMRDWDRARPISEDQMHAFGELLPNILATAYVNTGAYPETGVAYHIPHNYGVDRYLRSAAGQARMPCGAILQSMLPSIKMRMSAEEIAIKSMSANDWTVLWRKGETTAKLMDLGQQYRPRYAAA